MEASIFSQIDLVMVHYKFARPTVVSLNALFRHYPEAEVTLVDNSKGECAADERVLPHLGAKRSRVRLIKNPATDEGPESSLSHGGGIDLAVRATDRPYLLSMESDTIILEGGGIEFLRDLMANRYDWAGLAQKPVGDQFASFSPAFAIFRVDLLKAYGLSFRRRNRRPEDYVPDDPIVRHHLLAAEQAELALPLTYPEGKPPDTYRMPPERIVARELQHLYYFDTAEYVHHFLTRKGFRGYLFPPLDTVCHVWGSRDERLFLRHFSEKLPQLDVNDFLPPELHVPSPAQ